VKLVGQAAQQDVVLYRPESSKYEILFSKMHVLSRVMPCIEAHPSLTGNAGDKDFSTTRHGPVTRTVNSKNDNARFDERALR
jgi:hypothetical protein